MSTTERMLARAQQRIMQAVSLAREVRATGADQALEAVTVVLHEMPERIEEAVTRAMGTADARIFSRSELRSFVADFAIEMLVTQAQSVGRWFRGRKSRHADGG